MTFEQGGVLKNLTLHGHENGKPEAVVSAGFLIHPDGETMPSWVDEYMRLVQEITSSEFSREHLAIPLIVSGNQAPVWSDNDE